MLACGASLLAPAAPPPDGCIRLHWPLFDLVTHCPKAFLVAGGLVGRVLPLTRGELVCCGCIGPQATRAQHKEGKVTLKTGLDTPIKKGKASAPKLESINQPSPKAEKPKYAKLSKVVYEKGGLLMDKQGNILKMIDIDGSDIECKQLGWRDGMPILAAKHTRIDPVVSRHHDSSTPACT